MGRILKRFSFGILVAVGVASGAALADGIADMHTCKRMMEPLVEVVPVCTQALNSNDLTEAQIADTLLYRGLILLTLGEFEGALIDLTLSIDYNPEIARTYYYKGLTFEAMGEDKRAEGQFKNAYFYDPDDIDIVAKMTERGLL